MTDKQKIKLELTVDQVNVILEALGRLPFAQVYELIHSIQEQAQGQLASASEGQG